MTDAEAVIKNVVPIPSYVFLNGDLPVITVGSVTLNFKLRCTYYSVYVPSWMNHPSKSL